MTRVLITGASGFVGGAAWRTLRQRGLAVRATGRRSVPDPDYLAADLALGIPDRLRGWLSDTEVVIHAAARSSPWGKRRDYQLTNVAATEELLRACQQNGAPRFIYISSGSVYYRPMDQLDLTEDSPLADVPVNLYAASKIAAERAVQRYAGPWVILRPRAVYGAGDTVLFPRILAAARAGRLPLLVRPGTPARGDLIHIDNLVEYIVRAVQRPDVQGAYNLTDAQPVEINSFLLDILQRLRIPAPRRQVSVLWAFRMAQLLELIYGVLAPSHEPPITRFGVHVFAYSKTFNVTKMLNDLGPPALSTAQGIEQFVEWVERENPYAGIVKR